VQLTGLAPRQGGATRNGSITLAATTVITGIPTEDLSSMTHETWVDRLRGGLAGDSVPPFGTTRKAKGLLAGYPGQIPVLHTHADPGRPTAINLH